MTTPHWFVQMKKGDGSFELTVIRSDNSHGQISWGWTGLKDLKFLIAEGDLRNFTRGQMKEFDRVAHMIADLFNKEGL